jgi:putative sigma-54 modulation protein
MRTTVKARNFELTDRLRAQVERKLHRLERVAHPDADATVELIVNASRASESSHVAEVSLANNGTLLRSVGAGPSLIAALDVVLDRLERQAVRARERPRSVRDRQEELQQSRATSSLPVGGTALDEEAPRGSSVVKIKRFDMTPMFEEDAIVQMEELGHAFFVFLNAENERIGVVYRRGDGSYGLIDPVVGSQRRGA